MIKRLYWLLPLFLAPILAVVAFHVTRPPLADIREFSTTERPPRIRPDYAGVVIPPNIAPLNFIIDEPGRQYHLKIVCQDGKDLSITSNTPKIIIPMKQWRELIMSHRGQELRFDVYARSADRWSRFQAIHNTVSTDPIDSQLAYRLIRPAYNLYTQMGIHQRDLESYSERQILGSRSVNGCFNCHAFSNNSPSRMLLHVRGKGITGMILVRDGHAERVSTTAAFGNDAGYSSWHPNGNTVAFSVNELSLFYHSVGETRDVFDKASDLGLYLVDSNTIISSPLLADPGRLETFPAWSPDGRWLYFSSASPLPKEHFARIRYDLVRVGYNPETHVFGPRETVLYAADLGGSLLEPQISPDGRFLLLAVCNYGNFPVYQSSADLCLVDLAAPGPFKALKLEQSSNLSDSWHSWSSTGRWIVFASKRGNGLFGRPYFAHVSESGEVSKALVMPQQDPAFYDSFLRNYNKPELFKGPLEINEKELARVILAAEKTKKAECGTGVPVRRGQ